MVKDNEKVKKHKFDLIDFYQVLGIEDINMPIKEIRKKYVKLVVKYHPDKSKDADPQIFALIQKAWDCLGNEEKRKQYDKFLLLEQKVKKSDHNNLKKNFDNFMELKKTDIQNEQSKKKAELEFDFANFEMDKKHKFDRNKYTEKAPDSKETTNRFSNLMLEREQQEIEFSQSRMFPEGTKFTDDTLKKFNEIFDNYKHKTDNKEKNSIINKKDGPSAWNMAFNDNSFTSLDSFDNIYNDNNENGGVNYGNLNEFGNEISMDLNLNKNLNGADYVTNHNFKDKDYQKNIERKLKEREMETNNYSNNEYSYYENKDKTYMFTHETADMEEMENIDWDGNDSEELHEACNRLIEMENK